MTAKTKRTGGTAAKNGRKAIAETIEEIKTAAVAKTDPETAETEALDSGTPETEASSSDMLDSDGSSIEDNVFEDFLVFNETRDVTVNLTPQELADIANDIVILVRTIEDLGIEKKEVAQTYVRRIRKKQEMLSNQAEMYRAGVRTVKMNVQVEFDYSSKLVTVRNKLGEIIESRPMEPDELQRELPFNVAKAAEAAEAAEADAKAAETAEAAKAAEAEASYISYVAN